MKIKKIKINNFRSLIDVEMIPNGKSMVLFGINGTGKSSVLRTLYLEFAPILSAVTGRNNTQTLAKFSEDDISYSKSQTELEMIIDIAGNKYAFHRKFLKKNGNRQTTNRKDLEKINVAFQKAYLYSDESSVPIFVNYGTNRLVLDIPLRIRTKHSFDRLSAYDNAIENRIDFRTFFEWFRNQEDVENEEKVNRDDLSYQDKALSAVRRAIMSMMDHCTDIRVVRKPRLAMKIKKDGVNLNVSQLSDGEKCTMALFGDLARRLALANPSVEDPLKGSGIVLIDELELHMHPSWQRIILGRLQKTFPNVQFIVTTHSPLVLTEISDDFCLYSMTSDDNVTTVEQVRNLDGFDVNRILEKYMKTPRQSDKSTAIRKKLYMALHDKNEEEINNYIYALTELTDANDPDVIKATLLQKRREKENEEGV